MGWFGAALAYRLHAAGVAFSWHDTDTPVTAWRACTGAAYPAGDTRSRTNLALWETLAPLYPPGTVQRTAYAYTNRRPPFRSPWHADCDLGWLRLSTGPCFAVDAPAIVSAARRQFAAHRTTGPRPDQRTIVAHGHHRRRGGWVWGWSAAVQLHLPDDLTAALNGRHVTLYGRMHRFAMCYAYPIPTRPGWWWAGSSLINQQTPRKLNADARLRDWIRHAAALYPTITVVDVDPPLHGWRPKPRAGDTGHLQHDGARLTFPPLWHSGVRWAPTLLEAAAAWTQTGNLPRE